MRLNFKVGLEADLTDHSIPLDQSRDLLRAHGLGPFNTDDIYSGSVACGRDSSRQS